MTTGPIEWSPAEQNLYRQAQEMETMFRSPAFQRILAFMEELEKAALQAIDDNQSDLAAWPLQQRWRAAKQNRKLLLRYIESVKDAKRELLETVLRESGIPPNTATVIGAMMDANGIPISQKPEAFR